jgi:cobyrinic acid a,c-diamide synthase
MVTRQIVRDEIVAYLNRNITLDQLVDWAENIMNEGVLDPREAELLREVIGRIGVAEVRAFGLAWDDFYDFLSRLGYKVQVMTA